MLQKTLEIFERASIGFDHINRVKTHILNKLIFLTPFSKKKDSPSRGLETVYSDNNQHIAIKQESHRERRGGEERVCFIESQGANFKGFLFIIPFSFLFVISVP